jgi:hypothetical protein
MHDFEYQIKYLNGDDIIKLEKYLNQKSYYDTKQHYFFKFNPDRSEVIVTDKNGYIAIKFSISDFINKTFSTLRIFFKFKHLDEIK